jgi:hypothetical protein
MAVKDANGQPTHIGGVLDIHAHYLYDDDRPYHTALVMTDEGLKSVSASYGDTADADAVTIAHATVLQAALILEGLIDAAAREAQDVTKVGREVVFTRDYRRLPRNGGTVKAGTTGRVFWHGISHAAYSEWSRKWTTGVQLADGSKAWVSDTFALAVEHPEDYLPDYADMVEDAPRTAQRIAAGWQASRNGGK